MKTRGPYRVDGARPASASEDVRFSFNGTLLRGRSDDTLASALLANGVRTIARGYKYHRPRGIFTAGIEEPNALVQLYRDEHAILSERAPVVDLHDGLEAFSPCGWPNVRFDAGRILDFLRPLWAAGFYNKTFMWPSWQLYEGTIRRLAGFGTVPKQRDPDRYETRNVHCDVLIVGGGTAGLGVALAASKAGARVLLVEQRAELGGSAVIEDAVVEGLVAQTWVRRAAQRLSEARDVQILCRTTAIGYYDHDVVTLVQSIPHRRSGRVEPRERYWIVRPKRVVLATGAIEQPLIFCNNDRPGIMLAASAREYLRRHRVAIGRRVVVATNNDTAYATACDLKQAGVDVAAVADSRAEPPAQLVALLRSLSIPLLRAAMPIDTRGFSGLREVMLGRLTEDGGHLGVAETVKCDALAVSGGWSPTLHLYAQSGGKLGYNDHSQALEAAGGGPMLVGWAASTQRSAIDIERAYRVGTQAARQALHPTDAAVQEIGAPSAESLSIVGPRVSAAGNTSQQWVDLRHDVTVADIELALRERYTSIEHVKRYTTAGMAADQGKTSSAATVQIVGRLRKMKPSELGHTTLRPPFVPVTLGAIAGRAIGERFAPVRLLPMHGWHIANGAVMEDFGEWRRPLLYRRGIESREQSVQREMRAVRTSAGLFDGSPLGKIEIQGPDAQRFLDRFYINNLMTLKPGRTRYGIMLRETGAILDDGTIVMLGPNRFLITTTSGNAVRVAAWLEEWHQCEWPDLQLTVTPVTDHWATISIAGPQSRKILSRLRSTIDLSSAAFPHLGMREGMVLDTPTRIYRVSFTGELTYEINVPARASERIWRALIDAGEPEGLQPFGVEALTSLRLEKGFLIIGADTDATTLPDDIGWGKVAAEKAADFIGKRSLALAESQRPDRLQLVGLRATGHEEIRAGSHVRVRDSASVSDGWVTSVGKTAMADESIALARVRAGRTLIGREIELHWNGVDARATVVSPLFYDPSGERMNA